MTVLFFQQSGNHDSTVKVSDGDLNTLKEEASGSFHKKTNLFRQLPSRAIHRLPFHPFMFENEKDLQNTLLPMIHAELTLYNVDVSLFFFLRENKSKFDRRFS